MPEEIGARNELLSGQLPVVFQKTTGGVQCVNEQVKRRKDVRKGGLAVPEIMHKVVSLRLEGVEAFSFDLPARVCSRRVR